MTVLVTCLISLLFGVIIYRLYIYIRLTIRLCCGRSISSFFGSKSLLHSQLSYLCGNCHRQLRLLFNNVLNLDRFLIQFIDLLLIEFNGFNIALFNIIPCAYINHKFFIVFISYLTSNI